jgi:ribosomal protein L7/L12
MEVRMLLMQGRKIEAIKQVRDRQPGMGLKEAKDWVEQVEAGGV